MKFPFDGKAISVRQPWAWALIHAGKGYENRSQRWNSLDQTRVCIHASAGMSQKQYEDARDFMISIGVNNVPRPDELIRGAVIGSVFVERIVNDSEDPWFFGPHALEVSTPYAREPKGLTKGALGSFRWQETTEPLLEPKPWMKKWSANQ